ncbi:peptidoglycan endopeptidase [Lactobacillus reuteri]|uniref:NlpC/P60 family protein n=1 Tax=Limosilactobacillus reuteri TaxID=1598 RepID=UPI00128BBD4F|nr:NlpC/P60 family protein [Limosilactobacillus reuteri]MQB67861.1 peptidoglycan endopeptidase [Limosilactobacillus reuteri]MQB81390.1 peptidoglycan endopeptidase [Limosilactobacillus reuteri]MQB86970.1 peptidoglycan endopeptidase [Limosilactobacillus reuteri]
MQSKSHYKLFKAGKNWCTMMITLVAVAAGVSVASGTVHADTATASTQTPTVAVTNESVDKGAQPSDVKAPNLATDKQQGTDIDFQTPVNAGYIDTVTADTDNANTIDVSGWHATNQYKTGMDHYLIALNGDNNQELYRGKVETVSRPDVQKVYPKAPISENGGFKASIPVDRLNNISSVRFVSRYTNDTNGEINGGADFWYPTIQTKAGYLDNFKVNGNNIEVSGWHADDQSVNKSNHFLILFDKTKNKEITRQAVKTLASSDVARNGYNEIVNADHSRFSANFTITPAMLGDELTIVSRYSSDAKNGEENRSDYWFNNSLKLGKDKNAGYLDQFRIDNKSNKVIVSGWNANDQSTILTNHYLILFDKTANHEVARQAVKTLASVDVAQNGFADVNNADHARFTTSFDITPAMVGHQFVLVSRYTDDAKNGEGNHIDYWYNNNVNLNNNQAWLDHFTQNGTTISASGWHAADASMIDSHHFIILWDLSKGREIARKEVTNVASPDINNVYGNILGANNARFTVDFNIDGQYAHDAMQLVSRYSNADNGEGNYSQAWLTNQYLNLYQNPSWMYQINYSQIQPSGPVGHNIGPGYEGIKTQLVKDRIGTGYQHNTYTTADAYRVMSVQRAHGLPATGWVDYNTWVALGLPADQWTSIDSYVAPLGAGAGASRQDHIEAMIRQAYQYMGKPWLAGCSSSPAYGVDCSGLVMQALYAGGINPTSCSSIYHGFPGNEWNSRNLFADPHFMNVSYNDRQRGDLVFYYQPGTHTIWHVAIYLGNNQVIESWPPRVMVQPIVNGQRNVIAGIRRVFA